MTKKTKLIIAVGLLLLLIWLIIMLRTVKTVTLDNERQSIVGLEKTDDQGEVVVSVKPLALSAAGGWRFNIVLDTHTVELDANLIDNAKLIVDDREYQPLSWDGDLPGGHHRQGLLTFPALPKIPDQIILRIKNIGGVDARIFSWTLKTNKN